LLATFPAIPGSTVSTIVIGQAENTAKRTSTPWVITVLHEHFHQLQNSQPTYYADVEALSLSRGDQSGMWMLNFPFAYGTPEIKARFASLAGLLADALEAGPPPAFDAKVAAYLEARRKLPGLLSEDDYRYLSFQLWQEGMARYTEYRIASLAAKEHQPGQAYRALPDYQPLADTADEIRRGIVHELRNLDLTRDQRGAFYPVGAGEGLLLDRMQPDWQRRYFVEKFYVEKYFDPPGSGSRAEPVLFGEGVISTGAFETHPAFTPDGSTLYFVKSTPAFTDWKIWVTELKDGRWSPPTMAPFSGTYRDADPYVTPDGKLLYFISDRPVDGKPKEDMDIWVMERTANGWGEPRNLGAPVNSGGSEWLPRPAANGTLYFGSDRPGGLGATDLYRARRIDGGFAEPENLGANVNSAADEYEPCIAPDESFVIFMAAGRPDDLGRGDLYISYRRDGAWTPAKNLGPKINGPGLQIAPYLANDGKRFFFSSARKQGEFKPDQRPDRARNGLGDIYELDLDAVHVLGR
jgi:hypothetical protein